MSSAPAEGTRYAPRTVSRRRDRRAVARGRRKPRRSALSAPDEKAIVATVEPVHELIARARIGGTIASLSVKEGDRVDGRPGDRRRRRREARPAEAGAQFPHPVAAVAARQGASRTTTGRSSSMKRGVGTQVQVDAAKTALDVAERTLQAMRSDRDVMLQQMKEGAVLAPGAGRVLKTPVSEGSVVLPGETIATIAEDHYILRLQLPERHARFMRAGDAVKIGARGFAEDGAQSEGRVRLVYPRNPGRTRHRRRRGARTSATISSASGTRVYVATGERHAIVIPRAYVYRRAGVDFVKLKDGVEVVVQLGVRRRRVRRDPGGSQGRRRGRHAMKLGLSGVLTRTFINSPLTPLLLLAALVAGAIALVSLPREEEPQISVPMVDILVHGQRLQGRPGGRAHHAPARRHHQGHRRRRARLFADPRRQRRGHRALSRRHRPGRCDACACTRRSGRTSATCRRASPSR